MQIEDFIIASLQATSVDELFALYKLAMGKLGLDRIVFSLMTNHLAIGREAGHGIVSNYPDDWMAYYMGKNYFDIDPVRSGIFASTLPFLWDDMEEHRPLTKEQQLLMHEGREAGLLRGIGIPLRAARGAIAGIGAASSDAQIDLDPETLAKAHLLSTQFYAAFLGMEEKNAAPEDVQLSEREREILQWVARGKTRTETAVILGISPHTVNIHAANILKKFGTGNITVAAFRALNLHLIQL
ncbi:MAG: hypothetical protein GC185_01610 [Alphaproteobacteria bacterium]|nr:hypothetical protein [Alphaproteobacteria bacterium]